MNIFNLLLLGLILVYYGTIVGSIDIELRAPSSYKNYCQYQIIVCLLTDKVNAPLVAIDEALKRANCRISEEEMKNSVYHIRNALKQDLRKLVIGTYNLKVDPNDSGRLLCPKNKTVKATVRNGPVQASYSNTMTLENCQTKLHNNSLSDQESNTCIKIFETKIKDVEKDIANHQGIKNFKEIDIFNEPDNVENYSDEEKERLLDAIEGHIRALAVMHGVFVPIITGSDCEGTSKRSEIRSELKRLDEELKLSWVSSKSIGNNTNTSTGNKPVQPVKRKSRLPKKESKRKHSIVG